MTPTPPPGIPTWLILVTGAVLGGLGAVGLFVGQQPSSGMSALPGFGMWFGAGSGVVIVLVAWAWRMVLGRAEDTCDD